MFNAIKRRKATNQHLWFLRKQKINNVECVLDMSFFNTFDRAYIIAPHMDDEIHGTYSLINKLLELHKEVVIIYCVTKEKGNFTIKRIRESKLVFSSVQKVYLDMEDSELANDKGTLYKKLISILKSQKTFNRESLYVFPEYSPFNHQDHNAVNEVMNDICEKQSHRLILKSELIVPIKRTNYLPITDFNEKMRTLFEYKSQMYHVDYKKISLYLALSGGCEKKSNCEYREYYAK